MTYFYKTHSHIKSTDSLILKHEQLHFDIAEVFARKLREKIKNHNKEFFDLESYNKEIDLIYQRYFLYQERYDRETKHSLNIDKQNEWEEKINLNLLSSTSYTSEIYN